MHIDPAGVQLLFVDLQAFLTAYSATEKAAMIGKAAGALARTAKSLGMPITFSLVPEADTSPQPVPELQEFATAGNVFVRQSANGFVDLALRGVLSAHDRKTLVIAGFSAEVAVLHAGLDAIEAHVYVVVDAIGGHSHRTEQAALKQLERAGVNFLSASSLLSCFAPDFSKSPGSDVLKEIIALGEGFAFNHGLGATAKVRANYRRNRPRSPGDAAGGKSRLHFGVVRENLMELPVAWVTLFRLLLLRDEQRQPQSLAPPSGRQGTRKSPWKSAFASPSV
jgi:isochorismate hydrolase